MLCNHKGITKDDIYDNKLHVNMLFVAAMCIFNGTPSEILKQIIFIIITHAKTP